MPSSRKLPVVLTGLALLATSVATIPFTGAQANPAGTDLVISEVYGSGGNANALYSHDFVELYNPTAAAVSLAGMSIQYRSAANTGTSGGVSSLASAGSIPAGEHFVITLATNNPAVGAPVPNVDFAGSTGVNLSGTSGQVYLASSTSGIDPDGAGNTTITDPAVVDFVGYGTAVIKEGATTAPSPSSNATSMTRDQANTDTDVNGADFTVSDPTAGESYAPPPPPPPATEATIAEIQGTGAASEMVGTDVITQGVVTAAYPSGGFFGFYLQTEGTGGAIDPETHTASHGIFVRQLVSAGAVTVEPGSFVEVTGTVREFAGQTQIEVADAADIAAVEETFAAVAPATTSTWPASSASKETLEGMLYSPTDDFTVSDTYSTSSFGEVGLAQGGSPLVVPTEVADAQDAEAIAAAVADNTARGVILDDGASTNYAATSSFKPTNGHLTPPYVSNEAPVRVGAAATFVDDVIFTQGGSPSAPTYRFQPLGTVTGPDNTHSPATFEDTRTAAPDETLINADGTSDLKVASFNVLNYFTTLGDADDDNAGDGGCLAYLDREGDGNNVRTGCDQRGAWDPQDLARQQEKIVSAINALDADVIGLMEIENSAALGEAADEATNTLVGALNADAGSEVWAANPSSGDLPDVSEQDVITNAIIYKVDSVDRVGEARALGELSGDAEAFSNAREPVAQAFAPAGGGESFLVVVNHFKSKGSGFDDGTGQGNANPDRIAQAEALAEWVPGVQTELDVDATLLIGDFNAYSMEDPLQVLYDEGYTNVQQNSGNDEYSYSFGGQAGSLDHILANAAAMDSYTGVDVWNINSGESIALEYSRWNYHSTDFHTATPFRSSDHDPIVMGLDLVDEPVEPVDTTVAAEAGKIVFGKAGPIDVTVTSENPVTGTVEVLDSEDVLGSAPVAEDGTATVTLPARSLRPGSHELTVSYSGDELNNPSEGTVEVKVVKASSTVKATHKPSRVKVNKTRAVVTATVTADGVTPKGKVRFRVPGQGRSTMRLVAGEARLKLDKFRTVGRKRLTITYLGNRLVKGDTTRHVIRVGR